MALAGRAWPRDKFQANLSGADLSGLDLSRLDLSYLLLNDCNFKGCDLRGANLQHSRANEARFDKADLTGACMESFGAFDATFRKTRLRRVAASNAELIRADFTKADLREAWLPGSNLEGARFNDADLTDIEWFGSTVGENSWTGAIINRGTWCDMKEGAPGRQTHAIFPFIVPLYPPDALRIDIAESYMVVTQPRNAHQAAISRPMTAEERDARDAEEEEEECEAPLQMLFRNADGRPVPMRPRSNEGLVIDPDGDAVLSLEQAAKMFNVPEDRLRQDWISTWNGLVDEKDWERVLMKEAANAEA